ncbi:MAG TPA: Crp/Fnr family transcriptional regulator [Methylocystis sp.]|nr:Crp/Fnr family transcriptional regulator [Methylocystis sp.]
MSELPPLREFPIFAAFDDATLRRLASEAKVETYADGEAIFRQGDAASALMLVVSGFVKLLRTSASGDETVICIRGDRAAIADAPTSVHETCHVSAEAVGPTTVLKIPASKFRGLMAEQPALAMAALDEAKRAVAELVGEIESLKSHSADQRLARFLLSLCPAEAERRRFRLPYDKRLIAARLGVTQETLSRAFARLREFGVRTETRDVSVESAARLRAQYHDLERPGAAPGPRLGEGG